ncbi:hypothetical protein CMK10_03145, partial [Candidatus Poribacteria bacterium]|nr:hypothetical protein [Candidatus Poribacteria bacterium]
YQLEYKTYPILFNENVRKVLRNAVKWENSEKLPNIAIRDITFSHWKKPKVSTKVSDQYLNLWRVGCQIRL